MHITHIYIDGLEKRRDFDLALNKRLDTLLSPFRIVVVLPS